MSAFFDGNVLICVYSTNIRRSPAEKALRLKSDFPSNLSLFLPVQSSTKKYFALSEK